MKKMNYEAPEMELTTVKLEMNFLDSFGTSSVSSTGPNNIADDDYHDNVAW